MTGLTSTHSVAADTSRWMFGSAQTEERRLKMSHNARKWPAHLVHARAGDRKQPGQKTKPLATVNSVPWRVVVKQWACRQMPLKAQTELIRIASILVIG